MRRAAVLDNPFSVLGWESRTDDSFLLALRSLIDDLIFQREDSDKILTLGIIFNELCQVDKGPHFCSKGLGTLGSTHRVIKAYESAEEKFLKALSCCPCEQCQADVYIRMAIMESHRANKEKALSYSTLAVDLLEDDPPLLLRALATRAADFRHLEMYSQALEDLIRASKLLSGHTRPDVLFSLMIHAIGLTIDLEHPEPAEEVVEVTKSALKGRGEDFQFIRGFSKWFTALRFWREGDRDKAIKWMDSAIKYLRRHKIDNQLPIALVDLAMIRIHSPQAIARTAHVRQAIKESLEIERDEDVRSHLLSLQAKPTQKGVLKWREMVAQRSPMPIITPFKKKGKAAPQHHAADYPTTGRPTDQESCGASDARDSGSQAHPG